MHQNSDTLDIFHLCLHRHFLVVMEIWWEKVSDFYCAVVPKTAFPFGIFLFLLEVCNLLFLFWWCTRVGAVEHDSNFEIVMQSFEKVTNDFTLHLSHFLKSHISWATKRFTPPRPQ